MKDDEIPLVEIDWNQISTKDGFYDYVFREFQSPHWHGRNLNAINDSWVTGDINRIGPPYRFRILKRNTEKDEMRELEEAVEEIAKRSIEENGGLLEIEEKK